jgi:hypothetical protein
MTKNPFKEMLPMPFTGLSFTFADILGRRGDFRGDIRSVGAAHGQIISQDGLDPDDDSYLVSRLWISNATGKRHTIMTVGILLDHCFEFDTVIVPEYKLSFRYPWGHADFHTDKLMAILDGLYGAKTSVTALCEWDILCVAAAVCAVYEFHLRLHYEANPPEAIELLNGQSDDDFQRDDYQVPF